MKLVNKKINILFFLVKVFEAEVINDLSVSFNPISLLEERED